MQKLRVSTLALAVLTIVMASCGRPSLADQLLAPAAARTTADSSGDSPLARILVAVDDGLPGSGAEAHWLEEEIRYLIAREGALRLSWPLGPHDPGDGSQVHTLAILAPGPEHRGQFRLTFHAPDGRLLRRIDLDPTVASRLDTVERIAGQLSAITGSHGNGSPASWIGTANAPSYDAYTRVHVEVLQSMREDEELQSMPAAERVRIVERLERIVRRDPGFARAHAALALAYLALRGADEAALAELATRSARRALDVDPELPEAHAALGRIRYRDGLWLAAEEHFLQALAADPAAPSALSAYACFLLDMGRLRYAERIGEQASGLTPGSVAVRECLALTRIALGRDDDARETLGPAGQREPIVIARTRALLLLRAGDAEGAAAALRAGTRSRVQTGWIDPLLRAVGRPERTPSALRGVTQAAATASIDPGTEILAGILLGQADFAFNRLLRAKRQRRPAPLRYLWIEESQELRQHPRYGATLDALALPPYWQQRSRPDYCTLERNAIGCD